MDNRNFQYMFLGFLVAWLIVIVYVLMLAMRERKLKRELERVRKMVEAREKPGVRGQESGDRI